MSENERITELESIVNQLLIELSLAKSEISVTREMVLGIYSETMDKETSSNIFKNFVEELEKSQNDTMNNLTEMIIPTNDHSILIRKRFSVFSSISALKKRLDVDY